MRSWCIVAAWAIWLGLDGMAALAAGQAAAPGRDIVVVPGASPQEQFAQGRKWAVVIGINEYLDPAIPRLRYSVADARLVAETLIQKCGYEADRILLLTDDQEKRHLLPLRLNLLEQIPAWLGHAGPADTVLVFFAGHGFLDQRDQGYLAPMDCKRANLGLTGFRTDDLRNSLEQCAAGRKLLILDCCHAGAEREADLSGMSSEELGAAFRQARGLVTLASCGKNQRSCEWEAKGHGLFTHFLALGLRGDADFDQNGFVDSDELYRYVYDKVSTTAQRELNVGQRPVRFIPPDAEGVLVVGKINLSSTGGFPPEKKPAAGDTPSEAISNSMGMRFVLVRGGEFSMGSAEGHGDANEHPRHAVAISRSFYLGATEVTQGQYAAVMGENPSWFSASRLEGRADHPADTARLPVERVSYEQAQEFCRRLSRREGLPEGVYRLPTEAEWEYAARGGLEGDFAPGGDPVELRRFAWLYENSAGRTHEVGTLAPNAWGLYDMSGNVAEWCADWYDAGYYARSPRQDPPGPDQPGPQPLRAIRGGSWNDEAELCRPANRDAAPPTARENCYGFRLLRCLPGEERMNR